MAIVNLKQLTSALPGMAAWLRKYAYEKGGAGQLIIAANYIEKAAVEMRDFEFGVAGKEGQQ